MRRLINEMYEFIGQTLMSGRKVPLGVILLPILLMTMQVGAQTAGSASSAAKMVAPGMESRTRHTEKLEVPRKGKANLAAAKIAVQAELSGWTTINGSREVTVPPQGFYLATLGNGSALTVINGEEKLRHAGEMWAVQDGQSMTVKIQEKKQENLALNIFSVRPSH